MKKIIFSLLLAFVAATFTSPAQCNESLKKAALSEMGDSQYIKDYTIELVKTKVLIKFNVLLNSRNHYKFNLVNGSSNTTDVTMQLFDQDREIVSNYESGKMYKAFEFICRSTKVYQLVFSVPDGEDGCAEAVLSLVKQYADGEMGF